MAKVKGVEEAIESLEEKEKICDAASDFAKELASLARDLDKASGSMDELEVKDGK